jgi:hypothetical protein
MNWSTIRNYLKIARHGTTSESIIEVLEALVDHMEKQDERIAYLENELGRQEDESMQNDANKELH